MSTRLEQSRPAFMGKHQRVGQRADCRGYPNGCVPWGQADWGSGGGPVEPISHAVNDMTVTVIFTAAGEEGRQFYVAWDGLGTYYDTDVTLDAGGNASASQVYDTAGTWYLTVNDILLGLIYEADVTVPGT